MMAELCAPKKTYFAIFCYTHKCMTFYSLEISAKQSLPLSVSTLDKISLHSKQLSNEEWQFASFSSNTLTGAYGNLSMYGKDNEKINLAANKIKDSIENEEKVLKNDSSNANSDHSISLHSDAKEVSTSSCSLTLDIPTKVTNQKIFSKVRQFLHIFNQEKDEKRFLDLCKYLLHNTEKETSAKV